MPKSTHGQLADSVDSKLRLKRHEMLAIALLFGLAIAQPLFSLLGDNAEFFVSYRFDAAGIVAFALALSIGLPLVDIAVLLIAGKIHPGSGKFLRLLTQFLLWWLVWLAVASRLGLSGPVNVRSNPNCPAACRKLAQTLLPSPVQTTFLPLIGP